MPNMNWYTPTQQPIAPSYDNHGLLMQIALANREKALAEGHMPGLLNQALTNPDLPTDAEEAALAQKLALVQNPNISNKRPVEPAYVATGLPNLQALVGRKPAAPASAVKKLVEAAPGVSSEMQSKSALDTLMAQLAAHRQAKVDEDRSQMWMNFFSKMAGSTSPSLGGTIAEGATTLAPTLQAQRTANEARADKALEDQIALEKYKQDYGLKDRATASDELRARAAMSEAGASAAYRSKMLDMMGSSTVTTKNYPQLLNALTKMKEQEAMTGQKNPAAAVLEAQINQFTSGAQLTDPTMTGDPLGLRGPK